MDKEQLKKVCEYLITHMPKENDIETLDAAIKSVDPKLSVATNKDILKDDIYLIPVEEQDKIIGVKLGRKWVQSFTPEEERLINNALQNTLEFDEYTDDGSFGYMDDFNIKIK